MMFGLPHNSLPLSENGSDPGVMFFKERHHIFIEHMHISDRPLAGVEHAPGVACVTVNDRLQVDLTDAFQCANKEGTVAGMVGFDMPLPKLRAKKFQRL